MPIRDGGKPTPRCPICGDTIPFIFWVDDEPPDKCPDGPHVKSVDQCPQQISQARSAAERRQLVPECFDRNGVVLPSRAHEMIMKWITRSI